MEILFENDEFYLLNVRNNYPAPRKWAIQDGIYIHVKEKGFWYRMDVRWGQLYRLKYSRQAEYLNDSLKEVLDGKV